jgi:DNA-binding ferritin-like protein
MRFHRLSPSTSRSGIRLPLPKSEKQQMRQDQSVLDGEFQMQTVELLNQQLAAALDLFEKTIGSSCNVAGVDFIMFDKRCGQIALLMNGSCALIAERVQHLGGQAGWPVRILEALPFDGVSPASAVDPVGDEFSATMLDVFAQSLLEVAAYAEARGDALTADMLTLVWHDIDRFLWQPDAQDTAQIRLLLSVD